MTAKEGVKYLLEKVPQDEPIFILRGRDTLAPSIVLQWSLQAQEAGVGVKKVGGAIKVATEMMVWKEKRLPT